MSAANNQDFTPPYVSWSMFDSTLERMRQEGIPARVDRSFLHTASGSARAQLTGAFRSLDLIDAESRPTERLKNLVQLQDRGPLLQNVIETFYAPILALEENATQDQLAEAFRDEYGIQGSTVVKAISFYLSAATAAGIKLSPLFAKTRSGSSTGARRRRPSRATSGPPQVVPASRDLPEIVEALVARLPKRGEPWTADDFNWWLDMMEMAGPREYGFEPKPRGAR